MRLKKVPGYTNYWAGDDGNIYTDILHKNQFKTTYTKGIKLVQSRTDKDGYKIVDLWETNKPKTNRVHRLVLYTFTGPCPDKMECCHSDGDPQNNQLSNLRWDHASSNNNDKNKHGTLLRGSAVPSSKLNEDQVKEIKRRLNVGCIQRNPAKEFGVNPQTITNIKQGYWKHVEVPDAK